MPSSFWTRSLFFSISPFPHSVSLRKEPGDLSGCRGWVRKLSSNPSTPINHKAQAIWAARELLPGAYYRVCLCWHVSHFLRFIHSTVPLNVFLWSGTESSANAWCRGAKGGGSGITGQAPWGVTSGPSIGQVSESNGWKRPPRSTIPNPAFTGVEGSVRRYFPNTYLYVEGAICSRSPGKTGWEPSLKSWVDTLISTTEYLHMKLWQSLCLPVRMRFSGGQINPFNPLILIFGI